MNMKEIRAQLMGCKITYNDGFSGSHDCFIIHHIVNAGNSVRCFVTKGKGWGILIPQSIIPELLANKGYIEKGEIDHCPYERRWKLAKSCDETHPCRKTPYCKSPIKR